MAKRVPRDSRRPPAPGLLERIIATPQLERVVAHLQPELLHRVIQHCGLESCGQLVSLATPRQLARVFDLDLWRAAAPGRDEQFDAPRFGEWLEVMVDADVSSAAATLAAMDADFIATAFTAHVRVFDYAAVSPFITLDGDRSEGAAFHEGVRSEIGGFVVCAKRLEHWDAIAAVLNAMADAHGVRFSRIMRRCCSLSDSRPEIDGLDDLLTAPDQAVFDRSLEREARRDTQGYVTPAQARAFLQTSRRIDLRQGTVARRDPMTRAYVAGVAAHSQEHRERDSPEAIAAIVEMLQQAGVVPAKPRALLEDPRQQRLTHICARMQFVRDRDADAYATRTAELAYLANVLVAGSSIQSRPIGGEEASDAVMAVCNLGLENWPVRWSDGVRLADDFLIDHDVVSVFQVGWTFLHEEVCMLVAERLLHALATVECGDRDVQTELQALRVTLAKHWRAGSPWDARAELDVIATLDTPAWAALLGLIDQLPTMHSAVGALLDGATRRIDAAAFEFISENSQVQRVRDFMELLPRILRS